MAFAVRAINTISAWNIPTFSPWTKKIPADPLRHISTSNNTLSIFVVEDIEDEIDEVILGIASTRDDVKKFDYIWMDLMEIKKLKLKIEQSPETGETPINEVNKKHWNFVELYANDLVLIEKLMLRQVNLEKNYESRPKNMIKSMLLQAIKNKTIDTTKLKKKLIEELGVNI